MIQLTGIQGATGHEFCVLLRIWILLATLCSVRSLSHVRSGRCATDIHQSLREFSRSTGICRSSIGCNIHKNLGL